ncbi:MAG TPA: hypothetical protein VFK50_01000 [Sphingomicrobium sp.]|nr:hypothetical protein [Sphingomicrobium sp.]
MPGDETSLLPDPPPPAPARRDAAIDAALRRFDGVGDQASAASARSGSRWGFGGRPHYGAMITATLIVVIGLPAALIAIRDSLPPPRREMEMPVQNGAHGGALDTAEATDGPAQAPPSAAVPVTAPSKAARPEPNRRMAPSDQSDESPGGALAGAAMSAPVPVVTAPKAPPPPAPPPPPAAERDEASSADGQIVVTGSRIEAPNAWAERARDGRGRSSATQLKSNEEATAPDWVLSDLAYRRFLTLLQSAVRADDRSGVVKLVRLPLRVNFGGGGRIYRDARSVLGDYDRIFTPAVRGAILGQRFEKLFGRDQGVTIGNGAVWFDHVCRTSSCAPPGPVRITAINP